jgi:hypothetical protein
MAAKKLFVLINPVSFEPFRSQISTLFNGVEVFGRNYTRLDEDHQLARILRRIRTGVVL